MVHGIIQSLQKITILGKRGNNACSFLKLAAADLEKGKYLLINLYNWVLFYFFCNTISTFFFLLKISFLVDNSEEVFLFRMKINVLISVIRYFLIFNKETNYLHIFVIVLISHPLMYVFEKKINSFILVGNKCLRF